MMAIWMARQLMLLKLLLRSSDSSRLANCVVIGYWNISPPPPPLTLGVQVSAAIAEGRWKWWAVPDAGVHCQWHSWCGVCPLAGPVPRSGWHFQEGSQCPDLQHAACSRCTKILLEETVSSYLIVSAIWLEYLCLLHYLNVNSLFISVCFLYNYDSCILNSLFFQLLEDQASCQWQRRNSSQEVSEQWSLLLL